jgi:hypothetical protein
VLNGLIGLAGFDSQSTATAATIAAPWTRGGVEDPGE